MFTMEYLWLALVVLFAVAEAATVGLVSLWFSVGALAALIVAMLGGAVWLQIITFIAVSGAVLLFLRPVVQRYIDQKKQPTNADRVIGKVCPVTEDIDNLMGTGAVLVDGKTWTARTADGSRLAKGAYVVFGTDVNPELLFLASGSEVGICLEAAKQLAEAGRRVRVVSMPCWELFEKQSLSYRESVIPSTCRKRVIAEAGVSFGWERYAGDLSSTRYLTLDKYGESGPYKVLAQHFGFTTENVLAKAREVLNG